MIEENLDLDLSKVDFDLSNVKSKALKKLEKEKAAVKEDYQFYLTAMEQSKSRLEYIKKQEKDEIERIFKSTHEVNIYVPRQNAWMNVKYDPGITTVLNSPVEAFKSLLRPLAMNKLHRVMRLVGTCEIAHYDPSEQTHVFNKSHKEFLDDVTDIVMSAILEDIGESISSKDINRQVLQDLLLRDMFVEDGNFKRQIQAKTDEKVKRESFIKGDTGESLLACLLYTSPSPRDRQKSRMPSSA